MSPKPKDAVNGTWIGVLCSVLAPKLCDIYVIWTGTITWWEKARRKRQADDKEKEHDALMNKIEKIIDAALENERKENQRELNDERKEIDKAKMALDEREMEVNARAAEAERREAVACARERAADGRESGFRRELERAWKAGYEAALDTLW